MAAAAVGEWREYTFAVRGRSKNMWWGVAVEAPDPCSLATFYSALLDWPIVQADDNVAIIKPPRDGTYVVFQLAEGYTPPEWPPAEDAQRTMMHLDVEVDDLESSTADAIALGARLAEFQPRSHVRVMFDPAGHPFCLCRDDDQPD
jgi:predicted enzyme related to lactoylglutathione lyase